MSTTQRSMTSTSVKSIMQKRSTIPADAVGKRVRLLLQGDGNVVDVKDKDGNLVQSAVEPGIVLQKKIFNTRANSALAMQNERTRSYIRNGIAAEKLGADGKVKGELNGVAGEFSAHEWFNAYLNATQISFGVLLPSAILSKLTSGTEIAATVERIDTDTDNGSLLTIDPSTISVIEPEVYGSTTFNLDDFMADAEPEATQEETPKAGAKAKAEKV